MAPFTSDDVAMNRGLIADFSHEVGDIVFLHHVSRRIIPEDNSLLKIKISAVAIHEQKKISMFTSLTRQSHFPHCAFVFVNFV